MSRLHVISHLSPAKLNLGLKILSKRADGYHLLKTVFCLVDLCDRIEINVTHNSDVSLIQHQHAWHYTEDLAYRAALLLQDCANCRCGATIRIKKNIPTGAGLGGGSSNAATVLVALNHLWQTNLSQQELSKLGSQLGADVPFFIHGTNALGSGIGDELTTLTIPETYFVLVKPHFHISTKEVFAHLTLEHPSTAATSITADSLITECNNDLEDIACRLYPQLSDIIAHLANYGKPAMTGSGSVVFLRFNNKESAKKVAQQLANRYNTLLTKSLNVSPAFTACL